MEKNLNSKSNSNSNTMSNSRFQDSGIVGRYSRVKPKVPGSSPTQYLSIFPVFVLFCFLNRVLHALSLVSIWSSGSSRSPQSFQNISRRSGRLGRLVVSMWSSRSPQRQETRGRQRCLWVRGTQRQFSENICSEDDLRSRIFGTLL